MNQEQSTAFDFASDPDPSSVILHPFKVVIIGGGVSGLATAHRIAELAREREAAGDRRIKVTLCEASPHLGGIIRTDRRDNFIIERGPDSFITEKPEALSLARRVGLEANLMETNPAHRRSFVVRKGKLRVVPEGFRLLAPTRAGSFLRSDAFSLRTKARIALDLVLPRGKRGADADESLADFVRRRFGREALDTIAQPMIGGIYTADPESLSLRATMPRFLDMERDNRSVILALRAAQKRAAHASTKQNAADETRGTSGARYSLFLSFDEGMATLTERLAARLPAGCVRTNTRIDKLAFDPASERWRLEVHGGEVMDADAVCLALPAHASAALLRDTDDTLADELGGVAYASTAIVNLAYPRDRINHKLDGFGFVVPAIERRAVLACTFSSVKFTNRAPAGFVLLRAFVGGALQPETFAMDDDRIISRVRADLAELIGANGEPVFAEVTRWQASMAQYTVGHLARMDRLRLRLESHPTLHLLGNAYEGAGIPDCIRQAERTAERITAATDSCASRRLTT